MSLLKKKIKDLTDADHRELYKAVGTQDLPYPSTHFVVKDDGRLEMEIGIMQSNAKPLSIISDQSHDRVMGLLYREMAIPSLLHVQREALVRRALDSEKRLMAVFGDPGSGKSHMAKLMARMRDERDAEVIDCGGRYMGDLLFEQVIDFGEDFKTALTARIQSGMLSAKSVEIFDDEFSGSLLRDSDGQIIDVDWDKLCTPKKLGEGDEAKYESSEQAVKRVMDVLENTIAKWESIPAQTMNTVGIRKQPGPLIRAFKEGRELILDEYTKKIEGSDDSLQTVLQFLTGEIPEVTVENSMKVNGRQETYEFTFRKEDMKAGFFVTMTGNKQSDGHSTHALSRSAYSRISPFNIEDPLPIDWRHRISQVLTGLPLTTIYAIFHNMADRQPDEFAEMLLEIRELGLTDKEKAAIPGHQRILLQNWKQTMGGIDKLANFYMYWSKVIDPKSELYDPSNSRNANNISYVLPEISASFRDESAMDFRKIIQDIGEALTSKPEIKPITGRMPLRLNFQSSVHHQPVVQETSESITASELGDRLEAVLKERIGTMTAGRPQLQKALLTEAHQRSLFSFIPSNDKDEEGQEKNSDQDMYDGAPKPETLSDLLNQDVYSSAGGIGRVSKIRDTMIAAAEKHHPDRVGASLPSVITIEKAASAAKELMHISEMSTNTSDPAVGQIVLLGDGLEQAFVMGTVVDSLSPYDFNDQAPDPADLITVTDFFESLQVGAMASMNMRGLWRKTISAEALLDGEDGVEDIVKISEGKHESKISVTSLMTQGLSGDAVPMHIMQDRLRQKTLIVADVPADQITAEIGDHFHVIGFDDTYAEETVKSFIRDSLEHEDRAENAADLERKLTHAFMLRAGKDEEVQNLATMMTNKRLDVDLPVYLLKGPQL